MSEAEKDLAFFKERIAEREKGLPFEERYEARRREQLEDFRTMTYKGWKEEGWKATGERLEPSFHAVIIHFFCWGVGMVELGSGYRISSGTVYNHIMKHNKSVKKLGSCPVCIRGIPFTDELIDIHCEEEVQLGMRLQEEMRIEDKVRDLSRDESDAVIEEWCAERFDPLIEKYRRRTQDTVGTSASEA
jgi:hypothetical protein